MPDMRVGQAPAVGAPPVAAGVVAPPPLIYAIPLAGGLLLERWYPIATYTASIATMAGIVCVGLGLVALPAVLAFRRANTSVKPWVPSTALVISGPYRFTRNPMYLGFTLLYAGVTLWTHAVWPLLFLPIVLVIMHYGVIVREEAYMARTFGESYQRYRERVRRWL